MMIKKLRILRLFGKKEKNIGIIYKKNIGTKLNQHTMECWEVKQ
jgi:hypothetical protein